ncbi:MAG: hypothetical protein IIX15_03440 [Clostridia bacterium]|nr:hypothetical protein [Clostridia bacterium]
MKHFRSLLTFICLTLTLAVLLCSCGARLVNVVAEGNDLYRNTKTGSIYQVLSASYEPTARGEQYGRLDLAGVEFILHEIPGLEPDNWLCSAYGDVYCNSSYDILPFTEWDINALYVCTNTAVVVSELTLRESKHAQPELCRDLFSLLQTTYENGPAVYYPSYANSARTYTLRFATDEYEGLYYCIKLIEYSEDIIDTVKIDGVAQETNLGRTFMYDRYADRCVPVSDLIFRMLDGASLEEALRS